MSKKRGSTLVREYLERDIEQQMRDAVMANLKRATIAIKTAAVADYKPKRVADTKIKRKGPMTLDLEATADILAEMAKVRQGQILVGFAAETGAAGAIFLATTLGIPVSTTHAITGAIVGVGATRRMSAVRWGVAGQIVWAWVLTIPAAALISAGTYYLLRFLGHA